MHCSRRLRGGIRGRLGLRLGRAGVSPLLRHSPVRAPPPGEAADSESALPLPVPTHGPHEIYLGNWPRDLHELEIAQLFHKYSIYPKHIHLHRKSMFNSYAFVELACPEDVSRAIDQLHGGKVLTHQIVVCRSRESRRQRGDRYTPSPTEDVVVEGMFCDAELDCGEEEEEEEEEECEPSPPVRPCSPSMPPLVLPAPAAPCVRRRFSDRDEELYETLVRAKRVCLQRVGGGGGDGGVSSPRLDMTEDSGDSALHDLTQDSGIGQQSARSSATHASSTSTSDLIRRRLREPVDVLVANFPANSAELDLMDLFGSFKPLRVRIMVNDAGKQPGDFTYAYVTVWNTMVADSAVLELDGRLFRGHHLVVEVRRS